MPNTLTEKALKEPLRVGLMLGALAVPSLWVASEDILRIVTRYRLLSAEEVTGYFASGAVPGMILGAGVVRAWAAWHEGNPAKARWLLMLHGGLLTAGTLGWLLPGLWAVAQTGQSFFFGQPVPPWLAVLLDARLWKNLPLQIALALLLFGILIRSSRA